MSKATVPGIPLSALNYVQDENTKAVLLALIDGWQMRNGQTGSGMHRFLTEADLPAYVDKTVASEVAKAQGKQPLSGGEISRIINNLQDQITESHLWKSLGDRIDNIDKPGGIFDRLDGAETAIVSETTARLEGDTAALTQLTALGIRVGDAETGLASEVTARTNGDTAIIQTVNTQYAETTNKFAAVQVTTDTLTNSTAAQAQQISTLQSNVAGVTSSLQTEASTRANADGELSAQYTVKIDNNGYVSGFGFASTVNNATALSEFYIRADRFAIGSPTVPHAVGEPAPPANLPFIVRTDNWVDNNGITRPGGVFMKAAWIEYAAIDTAQILNAAITTAKIQDAAIESAKIQNLAVTKIKISPSAFTSGGVYVPNNSATVVWHYENRVVIVNVWSPDGAAALVAMDNNSFTVRLDLSGGGTIYYSYL